MGSVLGGAFGSCVWAEVDAGRRVAESVATTGAGQRLPSGGAGCHGGGSGGMRPSSCMGGAGWLQAEPWAGDGFQTSRAQPGRPSTQSTRPTSQALGSSAQPTPPTPQVPSSRPEPTRPGGSGFGGGGRRGVECDRSRGRPGGRAGAGRRRIGRLTSFGRMTGERCAGAITRIWAISIA